MKKYLPYLLIALVTAGLLGLFVTNDQSRNRKFDGRITLAKRDKIPYGTYVAYQSLKQFFPKAGISSSKQSPGFWDSLSNFEDRQALMIVTPHFRANEDEMERLIRFAEHGNDVFISTMDISFEASQILKCDANAAQGLMYYFEETEGSDLMTLSLSKPPFPESGKYSYPGKRYDFYFYKLDTTTVTVLGYDKSQRPNFIHLKAGEGNMYVHLAPLAFSNYFLLHQDNIAYYENLMSVLPRDINKIVWDEYFASKRNSPPRRSNWIDGFLKYPGLKWALITAILILLLYVLIGMRRVQRVIPVIRPPKNDSLDFVRTIGRLYHDRGDHKNLSRKMASYFLEHVRSRYKLATSVLDNQFEAALHAKSGVPKEEIAGIVSFIHFLDDTVTVSDKQLAQFHRQLENFYKKT